MIQSSDTVWKSVNLTDELKINLEYDIHRGLLNIFVKNTGTNDYLPCHINVLSKQPDECESVTDSKNNFLISPELSQDFSEVISESNDNADEPIICYEISTTFVYDLIDENEYTDQNNYSNPNMITPSLSSSSSWCGEQTIDNDDGYSTHSLDDIEQQQQHQSSITPLSRSLVPCYSSRFNYPYYSEQYISPVRQLIEQLTWLNPFRKTIQEMMIMSHIFD